MVHQIQLADMHIQTFGYFGLQGIVNVNQVLPNTLAVSDLKKLAGGNAIEIKNLYDREILDMIDKEIEGSITKKYLKKPRLHQGEYEWSDSGGIKSNYRPTMIRFPFKGINSATRIGV